MTEKQAKINQIQRNLGKITFKIGLKNLQDSFKTLNPQRISFGDLTSIVRENGLSTETRQFDMYYYLTDWTNWQALFNEFLLDEVKYYSELFDCKVPYDLAWTYGLFFADGSCGLNKNRGTGGANWRIVNSNKDYLERAKIALDWEYKDSLIFVIKEYPDYQKGQETNFGQRKKTLYCLEATIKRVGKRKSHQRYAISNYGKRSKLIKDWRELFYAPITNLKMIPKPIFDKYPEPKKAFLEGVWAGDGRKEPFFYKKYVWGKFWKNMKRQRNISVNKKNRLAVVELDCITRSLGWKTHIGQYEKEFLFGYTPSSKPFPKMACDNMAMLIASLSSLFMKLNSCGVVHCQVYNKDTGALIAGHFANMIITKDRKIYIYDLNNGGYWTKYEKGEKTIIRGWEYRNFGYGYWF